MEVDRAQHPLLAAEGLRATGCSAQPLTLNLLPGDRVGLLGSTSDTLSGLVRTLARLQRPAAGRLFWSGLDVTRRPGVLLPLRLRTHVLMLWADPYALFDNGVRVRTAIGGRRRQSPVSAAPDVRLRAGGLSPALSEFTVASLSGLTRARVALAYAQCRQPRVILVDDLFAHLIPEGWPGFLTALETLAGDSGALIIASRFPEALRTMARIVVINDVLERKVSGDCPIHGGYPEK